MENLMDCPEYRRDRLHDIFCEIIGLATAPEAELLCALADQRANNENHQNRMKKAHALFEERYGRKA